MSNDAEQVARKAYQAYVDSDREAIEAVIADDFRFTSPLDNRIGRETYFERCWPNNKTIAGFDFLHVMTSGEKVFVTYEARTHSGRRFRNTEILTVRGERIVETEVYFGWSIPHRAPEGEAVDF